MQDKNRFGITPGRVNAAAVILLTLGGVFFRRFASQEILTATGITFATGMLFGTGYQVLSQAFDNKVDQSTNLPKQGMVYGSTFSLGIVMGSIVLDSFTSMSKSTSTENALLIHGLAGIAGIIMSVLGQRLNNKQEEAAQGF